MSENKIFNTIQGSAAEPAKRFAFFGRPLVLGILTFILLSLLFTMLIVQRSELVIAAKKKAAYEIVNQAKDNLQEELTYSLSATKTLAFFIDNNGQVNNFDSVAAQILESGKNIDALQLVPGGIIKYVYPLQGNETVIGYNILIDSARNKEAFKAIENRKMVFAGPFELRQGGIGVVGRLPVFRNNKFWGFSAVVIKMSTLFKTAGIDSSRKAGYYFQLSKINPDTKKEEYFLPKHDELNTGQSVSVTVPNGEWKLSVISKSTYHAFSDIALLALLGLLLSVLGAVFAYRFAIRPKKLNDLVINRTRELNASENKYRSLVERVSDAFIAIDKNWTYTYVNEKAGELLARKPESLIGKNIWTEFPDWVDQPFYHAYYRAMETQEYQYLEEYYPAFNKWFENDIYPSKEGLTIFLKDATAIKEVTLALKNNEEKYRSLIEHASDGIVITDLDGNILEANDSISHMCGFAIEEIIGEHLYKFLPEEDIVVNPLRLNELMQGKSLIYERKLLKKDGTILNIEVNSKMASTQTLIGFIRDISDRKNAEALLQKSYEDIRQLASNLQSIREDERTNIAREIHDELGQQLTGLKMDLHWLMRKINSTDKEVKDKMQTSIELINATITSVRKISTDLRPSILDDLGLLPALEWQGEEFEKRSGTKVSFVNRVGDIKVQPQTATAIFRIYQELLTNIARHANASMVKTVLDKDENNLYFTIGDNGVGFDLETINNKKTLGLLGIKERTLLLGGTYEFLNKPGEGSATTITIPLAFVKITI
ncbi:MAG: PAS domain S-box protein [Ferruginibacter sp.]